MRGYPRIARMAIPVLACSSVFAAGIDIEPEIRPGYTPQPKSRDEQGLWMEMNDYEASLKKSPLLIRDKQLNDYATEIVCRVAGDYCGDIRVYLARNPGFNASMAPNGMMVIWSGLFTRVRSEDELATIIGHEIAHYLRLHSLKSWRKARRDFATGSVFTLGVGLVTGVLLPVGESLALLSSLAFSREQEQEADLLGLRLLAEAGYDPHAAYRVWETVIAEESNAAAKREKPGIFSRTHPDAESRALTLRETVSERFGPESDRNPEQERYVAALQSHYSQLMEDQIDTNRYGRTEFLLELHSAMGIDPGLVAFYRGEMFRQRGASGDTELARSAYLIAISTANPHPEAFRNLGYIALKSGDRSTAAEYFRQYLAASPEAGDREMIEFYLEEMP
ncbi:MAG: M48 family metalloprotease [Chromatiales bacterium]|nr:M48 family metalloprotease [Chromatiales bacterium]